MSKSACQPEARLVAVCAVVLVLMQTLLTSTLASAEPVSIWSTDKLALYTQVSAMDDSCSLDELALQTAVGERVRTGGLELADKADIYLTLQGIAMPSGEKRCMLDPHLAIVLAPNAVPAADSWVNSMGQAFACPAGRQELPAAEAKAAWQTLTLACLDRFLTAREGKPPHNAPAGLTKLEKISYLIQLMGADLTVSNDIARLLQEQVMVKNLQPMDEAEVAVMIDDQIRVTRAAYIEEQARDYDRFSSEELDEAIAFYGSPAGRRLAALMSQPRSQKASLDWIGAASNAFRAQLQDFLKAKGYQK